MLDLTISLDNGFSKISRESFAFSEIVIWVTAFVLKRRQHSINNIDDSTSVKILFNQNITFLAYNSIFLYRTDNFSSQLTYCYIYRALATKRCTSAEMWVQQNGKFPMYESMFMANMVYFTS